ncbi:hypothetical protein B9Z55_008838 [Caenorhabditis nigoni]|uniref:Uncharacterized protein n=1 Tax=Caenorhabditis nigoni TaxID=1611254 RepID=A0A2G5UPX6_9PELO|nr:hypothetical protein B9Z55_008838 [Caenorhabditis nigoni]
MFLKKRRSQTFKATPTFFSETIGSGNGTGGHQNPTGMGGASGNDTENTTVYSITGQGGASPNGIGINGPYSGAGGNSTTNVNTTMATDPPTIMPNTTEVQTTPTTVTQEVNTTVTQEVNTTVTQEVNTTVTEPTVLPNGIPGVQENSTTQAPPTTSTTVTEAFTLNTTVTDVPTVVTVVTNATTVEEKITTTVTQTPETSTVAVQPTAPIPNPQPSSTGAPVTTTVTQAPEPSTAAPTPFKPTQPQLTQKPNPQYPSTPETPSKPNPESSRNAENSKNSTGPQNSYAEALRDEEDEKHDKELKEQNFKKKIFAFELGTCSMLIVASVAAYVFSFLAYDYAKNLTKVIKHPGKKLKKK